MSCKASSVMLDMKPAHAADAHVAGVRGGPPPPPPPPPLPLPQGAEPTADRHMPPALSYWQQPTAVHSDGLSPLFSQVSSPVWASSPQEDISPIFIIAPRHELSDRGVRAEVRPQSEAALRKTYGPVHEARPVDMSCKASSVTLAIKPAQASNAHVAAVRGFSASSPSSPQEDISPILVTAPMHVLSDSGVRAEVRPHALNVERNEWVNDSAVREDPNEASFPVHVAKPVTMSATIESEALAALAMHALAEHV
eukprot:scaffold8918_cov59-Phaeocystis_antarctica.AAC.2